MKKFFISFLMVNLLLGSTLSFASYYYPPTKTTGALGGAAVGALAGQLIGRNSKGTAIGAGIGALAGLGWGAYKQKQQEEFQRSLANSNVRVSSSGDAIKLNLPGGVTFNTNSATISSGFYNSLDSIANVLIRYPESSIQVAGFTDSTGDYSYNMELSKNRAAAVANYLARRGVDPSRLLVFGYGPEYPVATNGNAQGRSMNRRVEVIVLPPNAR